MNENTYTCSRSLQSPLLLFSWTRKSKPRADDPHSSSVKIADKLKRRYGSPRLNSIPTSAFHALFGTTNTHTLMHVFIAAQRGECGVADDMKCLVGILRNSLPAKQDRTTIGRSYFPDHNLHILLPEYKLRYIPGGSLAEGMFESRPYHTSH